MNANTIIVTTQQGLRRTTRDANGNWSSPETLLPAEDVRCLATDPHHPNTVYTGTQGNGIFRSRDRGLTWENIGPAGRAIKSIAPSRAKPGLIYAGAKPPAVFISQDGGNTWAELKAFREMRQPSWHTPAEPGEPYVLGLATSATEPEIIVAGIEAGAVLRSGDGGQSWEGHLPNTSRDCHSLVAHASDGNWFYQAGSGTPGAVSRDGGRTWTQPTQGLDGHTYGWAVAADPGRPEVWYISAAPLSSPDYPGHSPIAHYHGHAHAAVFRSNEAGGWTRLTGGLPQPLDYMAYALRTDPSAPGHLYAGLSSGAVWHTADYGETWAPLPLDLGEIHRDMVVW